MGPLTVDVGGTFTDAVFFDETSGDIRTGKALTKSPDSIDSVLEAIDQLGVGPDAVTYFAFGSTVAINAILERKGARTALVTTAGFRDVLEIDRGNRPDLYNFRYRKPPPFVPRALSFEVRERIDAAGAVVTDLVEQDIVGIAERCRAEDVEAVAIQFLHSYVDPTHEIRAASLLRRLRPDLAVTASHEICREWGEYERASTTVFNSYLQPVVRRHFDGVERALKGRGFRCPFFALQSNGGITTFAQAVRAPVTLIESGPSAGINAAAHIGEACGESKILYLDIGGTTAKCSIIEDFQPKITGLYWIGRSRGVPGYPVRMPVVDIVEIAIGGGSIGWLDDGGRLRVGPQSAGADPAPACYGRGGAEPTLTDANLIGNRIRADYFASGRMRLDVERARSALNRLGERLGLPAEAVAMAMLRVSDAAVIDALKIVSVQRGHDPSDFVLIASGGGGPLNAARLGQELGVREIIIPRHPGYVSAFGMLVTQPKRDFARTLSRPVGALAPSFLTEIFTALEEEARAYFGDLSARTGLMFDHLVDLRYVGQQHSITLHLDLGLDDPSSLAERFSDAHELAYKFRLDDHRIEMVAYRLSASAQMTLPQLQAPPQRARSLEAALQGERLVDFGDAAPQKVRVFNRDILPVGLELSGPALVEESSSTTAVLPGQRLFIDELGLLHIVPAETGARA